MSIVSVGLRSRVPVSALTKVNIARLIGKFPDVLKIKTAG